jgi:acyl-CoA thioesterase
VGDFGDDTAVEAVGDGRYSALMSQDWEIWGPNGGYVAAVLLRAAGAHSRFERPATFAAHFLGTAAFDRVDLDVVTLRSGGRSESVRVSMSQGGKPIAEAMVWCVPAELDGVEVDWTQRPDVGAPADTPTIGERFADVEDAPAKAPFKFWDNFEYRPLGWIGIDEWQTRRPIEPTYLAWFRLVPTPVFEDPWIEFARVLMPIDIVGWPAIGRGWDPVEDGRWVAPNLDLAVSFHAAPNGSENLLLDGEARIATGGLIGGNGRVWSEDGRLLATGVQQLLMRRLPEQPPA